MTSAVLSPATARSSAASRPLAGTVFSHLLFWSWNGIFLLVVTTGLGPVFLPRFVESTLAGLLPLGFSVTFAVLLLIPPAAVVAGIFLRRRPGDLLRLFYGLEMPLFFLALARLFLVRELTPPQLALVACAAVGLVGFGTTLRRGILRHKQVLGIGRLASLSLLLCVGLWVGALLLLYVWPFAHLALDAFLTFDWVDDLVRALTRSPNSAVVGGLGMVLFAYSATLLFALPVVAFTLYLGSWRDSLWDLSIRLGRWPARAIALAMGLLFGGVVAAGTQQPQTHAFAALAADPASDDERQERLDEADDLRAGLLNAYLAPFRYHGTAGTHRQLQREYRNAFGGETEDWSAIGAAHDALAAPWLYQGDSLRGDGQRAAELYESFFDQPLQRGDREAVVDALTATYDRDSVEAGLLDANAEEVWLVRQSLTTIEHGDWAEVELFETYENQTFDQQEVLYYFTLPESAVVTGLWLGDRPDREQAFKYVVSPRGAAQRVYRNEVRRRVDPALLEQVGPRQYRLRAFPIPPRDRLLEEPTPRMHLWMTFSVLIEDGHWPLPQLSERRNLFWDERTERQLNGEPLTAPGDGWLWPQLPANAPAPLRPRVVNLGDGIQVRATPAIGVSPNVTDSLRLAVVVDRSYSMRSSRGQLRTAIAQLQAGNHDIDGFLTAAPSRGEPATRAAALDPDALIFYGGHATSLLLQQLDQLRGDGRYHGVLLLTDSGGYELEPERAEVPYRLDAPLWLLHLDGELPLAYTDELLRAVQTSGGGIGFSVDAALASIAAHQDGRAARWQDGLRWEVTTDTYATVSDDPFAPLAARAAINALIDRRGATLDELHRLAKSHGIVTPYSSMIVLVDDRQREALRRAEQDEDRFDRLNESGKETTTQPFGSDLVVSGVPEPEEWALIITAGAIFLCYGWRRRHRLLPVQRQLRS